MRTFTFRSLAIVGLACALGSAALTSGYYKLISSQPVDNTGSATPSNPMASPAEKGKMTFTVADPVDASGSYGPGAILYSVVLDNVSGAPLDYAEVDCAFYDENGKLLVTGMTNWSHIATADRVTGSILVKLNIRSTPARRECKSKDDI